MNISGVWSLNASTGTRRQPQRRESGYGYLFEGAPYYFLAPKDSIKTFWRGGFKTPAEIETYDTPFSFENDVTHQWTFVNDTWNVGRLLVQRRLPVRLVPAVLRRAGKSRRRPVPGPGHLSRVHVPSAERPRAARRRSSTTCSARDTRRSRLAYGRYSYNAGTMTNANSMMAGFVNPMAKTTKRYRWDGTLPFVPEPGQADLDDRRSQPQPRPEPGAAVHGRIRRRDRSAGQARHDGPLQLRAEARTQPDEAAEHRHSVFGLQHSGPLHRSRPRLRLRRRRSPDHALQPRSELPGPPGRSADQRSAEPLGLRDLQRRGGEASLQPSRSC